jgi:hypothetical protein
VACWQIVQRYREEGRPFASCDLLEGADPADTEVVFRIAEGRRSSVRAIGYAGRAEAFPDVVRRWCGSSLKLLKADVEKRAPWLTGDDIRELIRLYRACGFPDARIERDLVYSDDDREVTVILRIDQGARQTDEEATQSTGKGPDQTSHEQGPAEEVVPLSPRPFFDGVGERWNEDVVIHFTGCRRGRGTASGARAGR